MKTIEAIVSDIGFFFYNKTAGDGKGKILTATKEIENFGITNISLEGSTVSVRLMRPGLFIGRLGLNIKDLKEYLKEKSDGEITDICVVEDRSLHGLYDFTYDQMEDFDYDEGL